MADDVIKTLLAEAYGEGPEGMRLVAETILNRAAIRGLTPEQVVRQRHQYTGLTQPGPRARELWTSPKAIAAAQAAFEQAMQPGDPTGGADHYYAPGTISQPYWAKSMTDKGQVGGHKFYSSRPVPPGELNQLVGTLTDTTGPRAPKPRTPSKNMAAYRFDAQVPSSLVADTMGMVSKPAKGTKQIKAADLAAMTVKPTAFLSKSGNVQDMAQLGLYGKNPDYLQIGSLPKAQAAKKAMTTGIAQSYAGQEKGPPKITPKAAPKLAMGGSQSYVGQERSLPKIPGKVAPTPATKSIQMAINQATAPALKQALNQKYPAQLPAIPSSSVGKPPVTKAVQSVAVAGPPPMPKPRPNTTKVVASIPTIGKPTTAPKIADIYKYGGPTQPGMNLQDKLLPTQTGLPAKYGTMTPNQVAMVGVDLSGAPTPVKKSPNIQMATAVGKPPKIAPIPYQKPFSVGTQLAVTPPKVAPVPFAKPNFGIGGPDLYGLSPVNMAVNAKKPLQVPLSILVQGAKTIQPQQLPPQPNKNQWLKLINERLGSSGTDSISSMGGGSANLSKLRDGYTGGGRRY